MIVVSDTTPLISFLKIGHIDLLEKLFGIVYVPQAVYRELTIDERFSDEAEQIDKSTFVIVKEVTNMGAVNVLKRATGLDQGESEAIVLSDEMNADILLMDEMKGRKVSEEMGIKVMGTIGVLMVAYEERELTAMEARGCIEILQKNGRHISQLYYERLLNMLND